MRGLMLQTWHTKTNKWLSKSLIYSFLASWKIGLCKQEILLFLSFVLLVSKEKVTKIIKFNWGHLCLLSSEAISTLKDVIRLWKHWENKRGNILPESDPTMPRKYERQGKMYLPQHTKLQDLSRTPVLY